MVIIEETDKSKRGERERWIDPEASKAVLTPKIINFEQGREGAREGRLRGRAESCEIDKEHYQQGNFFEKVRALLRVEYCKACSSRWWTRRLSPRAPAHRLTHDRRSPAHACNRQF